MKWESAVQTHRGKVRRINEDAVLERPDLGLWVVADGMGGYETGDVASQMVVDTLGGLAEAESLSQFVDAVDDGLLDVNQRIQDHAAHQLDGRTMGSTIVSLILCGQAGACVWAGDSRLYRLREGRIEQLSRDHSHVQELVDAGELLPEEAESHHEANVITRAVGALPELYTDTTVFSVRDGDTYLLCSDGLYKEIGPAQMAEVLGSGSVVSAASSLLDSALERGARDNVSVAVVRCHE